MNFCKNPDNMFHHYLFRLSRRLKRRWLTRLFLPIVGLCSTLWFLFRVIPKPSRAGYPCMKVAAPLASSFIAYIAALSASVFAFKKARQRLFEARYFMAGIFLLLAIAGVIWMSHTSSTPAVAAVQDDHPVNQPMGQAVGIYPGRVTWIWNPDATRKACTNKSGDYWWMSTNDNEDVTNDQDVIDHMLSQTLQCLTGETSDAAAWDALFRYYNQNHGKGDVGYQKGEKVVVKINLGCEWSRLFDNNTLVWMDNNRNNLNRTDSTPQMALAILRQLVNRAGIAEEDIGIGDPIRKFTGPYWDLCHPEFPDVKYWSCQAKAGRTQIHVTDDYVMFYSDGNEKDKLWKEMVEADYMINMPVIKAHARAGITGVAKNHFGSHSRTDGASHLHYSLPDPNQNGTGLNDEMGMYRCFVDIMGHKDLGGKTMLYLVDGLWGSSEAVQPPNKWKMAPFDNDWPSSILASQDPVAIESVCYDFLVEEFTLDNYSASVFSEGDGTPYPSKPGTQDYIHQAADPANWPADIEYDPEDDGSVLGSLGVHEHWNNSIDKQYSRNLGTGNGIELVQIHDLTGIEQQDNPNIPGHYQLHDNYPNPFNPKTNIQYTLDSPAHIRMDIFNVQGELIRTLVNTLQSAGAHTVSWDGTLANGMAASSGKYFYRFHISGNNRENVRTGQMMLLR